MGTAPCTTCFLAVVPLSQLSRNTVVHVSNPCSFRQGCCARTFMVLALRDNTPADLNNINDAQPLASMHVAL